MSDVEIKPINADFVKRAILERNAELCYQKRQFDKAISFIGQLIEEVKQDPNELGWYVQLKATYEYSIDKRKSIDTQLSAFKLNSRLFRPPEGVQYTKLSRRGISRAQKISEYIKSKDSLTALVLEVDNILENLSFGGSSDIFEDGIDNLGKLLGFETERPARKYSCGPDNLWQIDDAHYWIIECKNGVTADRGISKTEAGQMDTSIGWFEETYEGCENTPVLIHPSNKFMQDAFSIKPLYSLQQANLEKLKDNVRNFYKSFSGLPPSTITPEIIKPKIMEYSVDSEELKTIFLTRITK
jgi:tetratricopeptide (TPR) repeat protein